MASIELRKEEQADLSPERIAVNISVHIAAADGNYSECEKLLKQEGADAWWEDESVLNWSALHFAANGGHVKVVKLLLRHGAIWNAVDSLGMTAAEIAWSYNDEKTYRAILEEGVRQVVIQNLLHRSNLKNEGDIASMKEEKVHVNGQGGNTIILRPSESAGEVSANNKDFLKSKLQFVKDEDGKQRCLDVDGGLVMAAWETDIMEKTVDLLCKDASPNFTVLNIGFGLGIIDGFFQKHKPSRHVIVEAHPDAIAFACEAGWDRKEGVELIHGRWEDVIAQVGDFDIVYWDTYAQDYHELRNFLEELPNLLAGPQARFSFFHGLAGTNAFFYDVYTRVAEYDLREIGLDTEWHTIRPQLTEETWKGIKRKYWSIDVHRIPICRMLLA